jgi:hypothetical protein
MLSSLGCKSLWVIRPFAGTNAQSAHLLIETVTKVVLNMNVFTLEALASGRKGGAEAETANSDAEQTF